MGVSEPAANTSPASVNDPEDDKKKTQKDKWKSMFSLTNPDLWIAISVIVIIICLVRIFLDVSSNSHCCS